MDKACKIVRNSMGRWSAAVCAALVLAPGASVGRAAAPAAPPAPAAPSPTVVQRSDSGAQLSQANESLERQRVAQQIEEDRKKKQAQVETDKVQTPEQSAADLTFELTKVEIDASEILSETELQGTAAPYIGKTVALSDLYAIRDDINRLYADKGYLICKAYLPPQRIRGGVVQIKLLEGRTGRVTVSGLHHTKEGYVTSRVPLKPDTIANTAELNRQLQYFNGTNDVQLRMLVHAGEKPGTTDYEIVAYEPKNHSFMVYMDNNGYESSGRLREGLFYNLRSLSGIRDRLRLNFMRSQGTNIFGIGYSVPVSKLGTRLDIDYSTNTTKVINGELSDQDIHGHASAISLALRHPLRVDRNRRDEVGIQYLNQISRMDWGPVTWTDDKRSTFVPYISFTRYGDSSVFYHRHSFPFTSFRGANFDINRDSNYFSYQLNMLYEKRYMHGQMFSVRLDGQFADDKDRSASDRFYLGGANSVRGYEESFVGGNKGVTLGLTYQMPLDKKQQLNAFVFFDYGWISDDLDLNAGSYSAYSTGLGITASYRNFYAGLTLGIPLKRSFEFTTKEVSSTRLDFVASVSF